MNDAIGLSAVLAYFDPGAGSLLLQSLVGGAAGFLVFGHYLWTRISTKMRRRK
jgi:hypothetical protein